MSSIFAGTEPPAWLEAIAKPIDSKLLGQTLGGVVGAVAREAAGASGDKNYSTNFLTNLDDSFNSIRDPLWKVKSAQIQNEVQSQQVQLQSQQLQLENQKAENSAWMEDAPTFAEAMKQPPEWLAEHPISARSQRGIALARQINDSAWKTLDRRAADELRAQNSANARDHAKVITEFGSAIAEDPLVLAEITALPGHGYTLDQKGQRMAPSPEAVRRLDEYRAGKNLPRFGISAAEAKVFEESQKAGNRKELQTQRAEDRVALERVRQEKQPLFTKLLDEQQDYLDNGDTEKAALVGKQIEKLNFTPEMTQQAMQVRQEAVLKDRQDFTLALESAKQSNRVELETMREAAQAAKKKDVTEKEFITKNSPGLLAKLIAKGTYPDVEQAGRMTKLLLHGLYKGLDKAAPVAPAAGPSAPYVPPWDKTNAPSGSNWQSAPLTNTVTAKVSPVSNPYKVGARYGDLRYKGGDPNAEASWETIQ